MHTLVPFGKGVRADLGQSRGAQSGEADRHGIWLSADDLEPKVSPFDPQCVAGRNPAAGARVRLRPNRNCCSGTGIQVPVSALTGAREDVVDPTHDGLFSSGTLGTVQHALFAGD